MRYAIAMVYAYGRILDAACGCGYGASLLEAKGYVVGVDADEEAIKWAEKYYPGPRYIVGRIEEGPWEGQYETVVSLETIEHLPNPSPALKAFRKACLGLFIASVPNEELYPFEADNFAEDDSPHYRHYTPREFDLLLEEHGFKVLHRFAQVSKAYSMPIEGTEGRFLVYVCA
jgi:SAM-dependent methyltransferase